MSEQNSNRTRYYGGPGASQTVATLVVIGPEEQAGRSVTVGLARTVLGRDATCDLVLPSDQISRRHAAVRPYGDGFLVEDLNSLNGTSLNDRSFTGAVMLRDGDRLRLADVEIEFRLRESRNVPPIRSQPRPGAPWRPEAPTQPTGQVDPPEKKKSLRRELHDAPGFSGTALLLTIAGSVVGTVLVSFVEVGQWGSLAGAAIAPVVTATFTTRRTGESGWLRTLIIVILSGAALLITVTGVSAAEVARNDRATPGPGNAMTFPLPGPELIQPTTTPTHTESASPVTTSTGPTGQTGPVIEAPSAIDCGTAPLGTTVTCESVTVRSAGTEDLEIGQIEWAANPGDFDADFSGCEYQTIPVGQSCQFTVNFTPQESGDRSAELVIHQNLPPPDTGTPVAFAGVGS